MPTPKNFAALSGIGLLFMLAPALHAQVTDVPLFFTNFYAQTASSTTTFTNSTFTARVIETSPGDINNATLTSPNITAAYSAPTYSPTTFNYGDTETTQTALSAAFPFGTYTTGYSGGTAGSGEVQADYTQSAYGNDAPEFTSATYSSLQGLDASQPLSISWNSFDTGSIATKSFVFFTIADQATGASVYSQSFLPSATTTVLLPADTLVAGTTYSTDLVFSNRLSSTDAGGFTSTLGFDQRTESSFTTAAPVPEASTTVSLGLLLALGLGSLAIGTRKKQTRTAAQ